MAGAKNDNSLIDLILGGMMRRISSVLMFLLISPALGFVQEQPDAQLLQEILKMPAIDNHTHVKRAEMNGQKDDEFDALPCDPLEPSPVAFMERPENPENLAAWKALWNYKWNDRAPEHVKEVVAAREAMKKKLG